MAKVGRIPKSQRKAGPYRLSAFVLLLVANVYCMGLIFLAPHFRHGEISSQEANSVAFVEGVVLFLPFVLLFGSYFSMHWGGLAAERLYHWQAIVGVALTAILTAVLCVGLTLIVFNSEFVEPPGPGGHQPANPRPFERSFTHHAERLFLFAGAFLTLVLAMGILIPVPESGIQRDAEDDSKTESEK